MKEEDLGDDFEKTNLSFRYACIAGIWGEYESEESPWIETRTDSRYFGTRT